MKLFIFFLLWLFIFPILNTNAWTIYSSKKDILKEFEDYNQPAASGNLITQGNMRAEYIRNESSLTDKIVLKLGKVSRTINGPWSKKSNEARKNAIKLRSQGDGISLAGFHDYQILKLSPSGNYIEFIIGGYENWSWVMINTRTGKVVLEGKIIKSMWSDDRKQFIFQTCNPKEMSAPNNCTENLKTFITKAGDFPKFSQIQ